VAIFFCFRHSPGFAADERRLGKFTGLFGCISRREDYNRSVYPHIVLRCGVAEKETKMRTSSANKTTAGNNSRRLGRRSPVRVEELEPRVLLSGSTLDTLLATPNVAILPAATSATAGYTPAQIRTAYGFNPISGNGAGQTIAIIDAYSDPKIWSDLATFDTAYGLQAPPSFTVVQQVYNIGPFVLRPPNNPSWATEISLDVEWAHALAPGANIMLLEAYSPSYANLFSAIDYARSQKAVSVISMSWGSGEFSGETSYDSHFTTPNGHTGISFVASTGDSGSPGGYPAYAPNVVAAGGTSLTLDASGNWVNETGWSGSGGGISQYESEPSYQQGVQQTGKRSIPDVAWDANPNTGVAVYDSDGAAGWIQIGGTSVSAPSWAALLAIADQERVAAGFGTLANAPADLYSLAASDFHDITSGSNGAFSAGVGYDMVTGLGSPYANLVVSGLVGLGAGNAAKPLVATSSPAKGNGHANAAFTVLSQDSGVPLALALAGSQSSTVAFVTPAAGGPVSAALTAAVTNAAAPLTPGFSFAATAAVPASSTIGVPGLGDPAGLLMEDTEAPPAEPMPYTVQDVGILVQVPAASPTDSPAGFQASTLLDIQTSDAAFSDDAWLATLADHHPAGLPTDPETAEKVLNPAVLAGMAVFLGGFWQAHAKDAINYEEDRSQRVVQADRSK
jgi:hypothetical protein